jgi:undecaprenyl-diphosphatase
MSFGQLVVLAVIQGLAEILPVSSSAHVILAQHAMGLDPSAPEMTFFLVMLHTGTMLSVLLFFAGRWRTRLQELGSRSEFLRSLAIASVATATLGFVLKFFIEHVVLERWLGRGKGEVEALFSVLPLLAVSLFAAGILIAIAGTRATREASSNLPRRSALVIGLVQGLCLPFRGLSRSGATISSALLLGISRPLAEDFSFALAVILTPPVIAIELHRLFRAKVALHSDLSTLLGPGLTGMFVSFLAGLFALKWMSHWLEKGRWQFFGYYCVLLALITATVSLR